ncbi:MAG: PUA domain-containing protein, partial [Methanomassiliicoccales archaeon]
RAESTDYDLIFVENEARALVHDGTPFLTVRGILAYGASRYFVTVDMGAVPHVYNGADVMTPGIVEADPDIEEGDLVWVRDQKNRQPLAVGQALLSGEEMVRSESGKGIRTLHHVGDRLWRYDQE